MARTNLILSTSLALALTLSAASLAVAAPIVGSDYENGGRVLAATAVRVPAGFHLGYANGDDLINRTAGLPGGAKGAVLETIDLGFRGQVGPLNGSDYMNLR